MADSFHWADYLVFAMSLVLTLAIGIYFGFRDRKDSSTENFLMGGRTLAYVPVAFSLVASTLNSVFIIGLPAEIFYFGPVYSLNVFGFIPMAIVVAVFIVPTVHRLELTSAYEVGTPDFRILSKAK